MQRRAVETASARPPRRVSLLRGNPGVHNHLSPALCDELEDALGTSPGAVVVASHDWWLRRRWAGREVTLRYSRW